MLGRTEFGQSEVRSCCCTVPDVETTEDAFPSLLWDVAFALLLFQLLLRMCSQLAGSGRTGLLLV